MEISIKVAKKAQVVKRFVECVIEVRPTDTPYLGLCKTQDERDAREIKWHQDWAKDFREFLRDHRSQDVQDVIVNVVMKDACSLCGNDWEVMEEDGKKFCAWCGEEV